MRLKKEVWVCAFMLCCVLMSADCDDVVAWLWYHAIVLVATVFVGGKLIDD